MFYFEELISMVLGGGIKVIVVVLVVNFGIVVMKFVVFLFMCFSSMLVELVYFFVDFGN